MGTKSATGDYSTGGSQSTSETETGKDAGSRSLVLSRYRSVTGQRGAGHRATNYGSQNGSTAYGYVSGRDAAFTRSTGSHKLFEGYCD